MKEVQKRTKDIMAAKRHKMHNKRIEGNGLGNNDGGDQTGVSAS